MRLSSGHEMAGLTVSAPSMGLDQLDCTSPVQRAFNGESGDLIPGPKAANRTRPLIAEAVLRDNSPADAETARLSR